MKRLFNLFKRNNTCNHKWQARWQNRYGTITYRLCLKCREAQCRVNNLGELDKFEKCDCREVKRMVEGFVEGIGKVKYPEY